MSERQRVLMHAFPTFAFGGQQARFVQLANAYGPRYRHLVVAMDGCFEAGQRLHADVPWQVLPFDNRRGGGLTNRRAARELLARVRPDLLFTYNWGAIEWLGANWPRLVPHVHVEDGFGPDEAVRQLPRRLWTRRLLVGLAGTPVAVPSLRLAQLAQSWWVRPSCLKYIPNGVPVSAVFPVKEASQPRRHPLVMGTVAGMRPEKNLARLLRAFAAVRGMQDMRLVLIGEGPERPRLQSLAVELGVADLVEFTGYLAEPMERLVEFDLFALSSDTEQLPMAMLEAMAQGIPVVSTRVGDVQAVLPTMAHEGLSDCDDAAFTRTLAHVLGQQFRWPEWARAGFERVKRDYSEAGTLDRWRAIYDGGSFGRSASQ